MGTEARDSIADVDCGRLLFCVSQPQNWTEVASRLSRAGHTVLMAEGLDQARAAGDEAEVDLFLVDPRTCKGTSMIPLLDQCRGLSRSSIVCCCEGNDCSAPVDADDALAIDCLGGLHRNPLATRRIAALLRLHRADRRWRLAARHWESVFRFGSECVLVLDDAGTIRDGNEAAADLLGKGLGQLVGTRFSTLVGTVGAKLLYNRRSLPYGLKSAPVEVRIPRADLETPEIPALLNITSFRQDQHKYFVVCMTDVSRLRAREQELRELSLRDSLTGLFNRRGFATHAGHILPRLPRLGEEFLLFFFDLDGLKAINDTLGHEAGDKAIHSASQVLVRVFRDDDIVGRWGGDEFIALTRGGTDHSESRLCNRLKEAIVDANKDPARRYDLSLSWGTSRSSHDQPKSLAEMQAEADDLLYLWKERRRSHR